jgi:hypothetical protein
MIAKDYNGYIEGLDLTKIPVTNFAYPSKNILVHKGKAFTRLGIKNDGFATTNDVAVHGEFVWKDALFGEIPMRTYGTKVQMKYEGLWITIFSGIGATAVRVRFATWVDNTGTIIKKRLFFVDGSANIYEWTGGIGIISAYDAGAQTITISGTKNLNQLGFDDGSASNYTVSVIRFSGGAVAGIEDKTTDDSCADKVLHITATLTDAPAVGDLVIQKPITNTPASLSGMLMDDIYSYKNHLVVWNFDLVDVRFSHVETKLIFTIPAAGSRTALTAIQFQLSGAPTAMIAKKESSQEVLWISTRDEWFKITKTEAINAYSLWVDVERVESAERTGALPYAVAKHKGDIIYMGQDQTLSRITTLELTGRDEFELMSDSVEDLLLRVDMDEIRMYYHQRYIYILLPAENMMLMIDMVEGFFQPPQTMAISHLSVIDGVKYGHSSVRDETFYLFKGRNDLGSPIEAIFAWGLQSDVHEFKYKVATVVGLSGRMTDTTAVSVDWQFETGASRLSQLSEFDGSDVRFFSAETDDSFATHPFALRSWAGDEPGDEVKRFFMFDIVEATSFFEWRPIITVTPIKGDATNPNNDMEFELLAWYADVGLSTNKVEDDFFITR